MPKNSCLNTPPSRSEIRRRPYEFVPPGWTAIAAISLSRLSLLRDETRDACFHHFIESLPGLNAIDFVQRILRKGRDVKILSRASRGFGCGKQSRAALNRPCQQDLWRRLSNSCGDCRNDRIFEQPRPHSVTQWRESQKQNALFFAEFQKLRFRQIGM